MTLAEGSATWTSAGALGFGALFLALGLVLFWRWRRASARETAAIQESTARTVRLGYLYTADEAANDEFRLSGGLAVPLLGESEERIGTLAIFWRRVERILSEDELAEFVELSWVFGPALENARLFSQGERIHAGFGELRVEDDATGLRERAQAALERTEQATG